MFANTNFYIIINYRIIWSLIDLLHRYDYFSLVDSDKFKSFNISSREVYRIEKFLE